MKSFKKIFLMLTSFAMVVGTLLIGGSVKKTEMVEAAIQTDTIEMKGFANSTDSTMVQSLTEGKSNNGLKVSAKYYTPSTGHIKGNQSSASKNFYIYNDDPTLGSITKVELTIDADSTNYFKAAASISVGNESQSSASSGSAGILTGKNTITWNIDETLDYRYFKILSSAKFTSGTVKNAKISIEYNLITDFTVTFNANGGTCNTNSLTISNGSSVTLPEATIDNDTLTFGGWRTADNKRVGGKGEQYTPTENITLYAIWNDNTIVNAQNELNKVNPYMSYGFKYDVSSVKHGQYLLQTDNISELTDKSLIVVARNAGKYYALKNVSNEDNKSFSSVQVELDETTKLIKSESYINNMDLICWNVENVSTDGTFNLSNGTDYLYSSDSTKTELKLSGNGANYKIISKSYNGSTYYLISIGGSSRSIFCGSNGEFKFYATSNFGSSYSDEVYVYVVGRNVNQNTIDIKSYSNVDFRLKCGIDDTSFAKVTLPSGAKYGIAVSTGSEPVYYEIIANSKEINVVANPGNAEPNKYVIIKLGNDLLNNLEKVTTEFTTQAYLYVDGVYYLSNNTKTYSVASLTETAVNASVEGVSGLYNILKDMGCYKAA